MRVVGRSGLGVMWVKGLIRVEGFRVLDLYGLGVRHDSEFRGLELKLSDLSGIWVLGCLLQWTGTALGPKQ